MAGLNGVRPPTAWGAMIVTIHALLIKPVTINSTVSDGSAGQTYDVSAESTKAESHGVVTLRIPLRTLI
ncbi:hypothetical protein GCM10007391_21960 [Alteromonas halophila]|uniref:Uncharacterized protein n=1 Tax=Alteromonas halophila TaxID=516698 RepID=A0A918JP73_9ALTE|nr:hypothetical protein GCM10007391_21960 [Alteromonas halophila]